VQRGHHIRLRVLKRSRGDELAAHRLVFLARLEDEADAPGELFAVRRQIFGCPHHHGGVSVVPAGVHLSRMRGTIGNAAGLFHEKRVDVGAQRDVLPRSAPALQKGDHIGAEKRRQNLQTERREAFPDQFRGLVLLPRQFGDLMEPVTEFDDSRQDVVERLHSST